MKMTMSMWRMVERWQSGWRWRWNSVSSQVRQQRGLSSEACHWTWNESNANIGKSFWNIRSMQFQMKFTIATPFSTLHRTQSWTSAREHKVFKSGLCWLRSVSCFMRVVILIECLSQLQLTHSPAKITSGCTAHTQCVFHNQIHVIVLPLCVNTSPAFVFTKKKFQRAEEDCIVPCKSIKSHDFCSKRRG